LEQVAELAVQEHVGATLACSLSRAKLDIPHQLAEQLSFAQERHSEYDAALVCLAKSISQHARHVVIVKGRALQRWYPRGVIRESRDVDIVAEADEHYWSICSAMRVQGWELFPMAAAALDRRGHLRMLTEWSKPSGTSVEPIKMDVALRMIPIGRWAVLEYEVVPDQVELSHGFVYPGSLVSLIVLLAEVCERRIILRDLVDFDIVLRRLDADSIKDSDIVRAVGQCGLCVVFDRLFRSYRAVESDVARPRLASLVSEVLNRHLSWRLMASSRIGAHWPWIREGANLWAEAMRYARDAWNESALRRRPGRGLNDLRQCHSRPFSLLLLDEDKSGFPGWGRAGHDEALTLRTPLGLFLVTHDVVFSRGYLDKVAATVPVDWQPIRAYTSMNQG
jgi:hypothetical protein